MNDTPKWEGKKIPQTCFFYWGNGRMPFVNFLSIASFKKHHPDWKIVFIRPKDNNLTKKTWTSREQAAEIIDGKDYDYAIKASEFADEVWDFDFREILEDTAHHDVQKADRLRVFLMYKYGGMWSDTDVLYLKSVNNINLKNTSLSMSQAPQALDAVLCYYQYGFTEVDWPFYSTGALFASPKNQIFKDLNEASLKYLEKKHYQSGGPALFSTLWPTLKDLIGSFPDLHVGNLDYHIFYPFRAYQIELFYTNSSERNGEILDTYRSLDGEPSTRIANSSTVAVHWFNGHPGSATARIGTIRGYAAVHPVTFERDSQFAETIRPYKDLY